MEGKTIEEHVLVDEDHQDSGLSNFFPIFVERFTFRDIFEKYVYFINFGMYFFWRLAKNWNLLGNNKN